MGCIEQGTNGRRGTTLVELTVAVAILSTVFAVLLPLFAGVRNSADTRWAGLEMVQSARVLNENLCRHLARARRVTAVSADTEDKGWIEFEAVDGMVYRYAMRDDDCVGFGPVGGSHDRAGPNDESPDLAVLAGPVEYLRFVCYGGNDLSNPTRDTDGIRLVTWEAGLLSPGRLMQGKVVTGACCLRLVPLPENPPRSGRTTVVTP